jgi:hypothetical protein
MDGFVHMQSPRGGRKNSTGVVDLKLLRSKLRLYGQPAHTGLISARKALLTLMLMCTLYFACEDVYFRKGYQ